MKAAVAPMLLFYGFLFFASDFRRSRQAVGTGLYRLHQRPGGDHERPTGQTADAAVQRHADRHPAGAEENRLEQAFLLGEHIRVSNCGKDDNIFTNIICCVSYVLFLHFHFMWIVAEREPWRSWTRGTSSHRRRWRMPTLSTWSRRLLMNTTTGPSSSLPTRASKTPAVDSLLLEECSKFNLRFYVGISHFSLQQRCSKSS